MYISLQEFDTVDFILDDIIDLNSKLQRSSVHGTDASMTYKRYSLPMIHALQHAALSNASMVISPFSLNTDANTIMMQDLESSTWQEFSVFDLLMNFQLIHNLRWKCLYVYKIWQMTLVQMLKLK